MAVRDWLEMAGLGGSMWKRSVSGCVVGVRSSCFVRSTWNYHQCSGGDFSWFLLIPQPPVLSPSPPPPHHSANWLFACFVKTHDYQGASRGKLPPTPRLSKVYQAVAFKFCLLGLTHPRGSHHLTAVKIIWCISKLKQKIGVSSAWHYRPSVSPGYTMWCQIIKWLRSCLRDITGAQFVVRHEFTVG